MSARLNYTPVRYWAVNVTNQIIVMQLVSPWS